MGGAERSTGAAIAALATIPRRGSSEPWQSSSPAPHPRTGARELATVNLVPM
jgi:hypothetical protein